MQNLFGGCLIQNNVHASSGLYMKLHEILAFQDSSSVLLGHVMWRLSLTPLAYVDVPGAPPHQAI